MIQLINFLSVDTIVLKFDAVSKKRALEQVAILVAHHLSQPERINEILDALLLRERLGSTAIEGGLAIPHCRLTGLTYPTVTIITLDKPINFQGDPEQGLTDILVGMVIPEQANELYLHLLSQVAKYFSQYDILNNLRMAIHPFQILEQVAAFSHDE